VESVGYKIVLTAKVGKQEFLVTCQEGAPDKDESAV
jgi:hypothetical protein